MSASLLLHKLCYNIWQMKMSPIRSGLTSFILCLAALLPARAAAQEPSGAEEIRMLCNDIMTAVYNEIISVKEDYEGLEGFSEDVLFENSDGFYAIVYESNQTDDSRKRSNYGLGLAITGINDTLFQDRDGRFETDFPLLGVKMTGYQPRFLKRSQLDIRPLVKKYGLRLADHQQALLPIRLSIEPVKDTFNTGEEVVFDVVLKNTGKSHTYVNSLGSSTLFFLLNNSPWGTRPSEYEEGGQRVILRAGEEVRVRFRGDAYLRPQRISIYGVYNLSIKGVNPYAGAEIHIVE